MLVVVEHICIMNSDQMCFFVYIHYAYWYVSMTVFVLCTYDSHENLHHTFNIFIHIYIDNLCFHFIRI